VAAAPGAPDVPTVPDAPILALTDAAIIDSNKTTTIRVKIVFLIWHFNEHIKFTLPSFRPVFFNVLYLVECRILCKICSLPVIFFFNHYFT
jgi:hypothetical protein